MDLCGIDVTTIVKTVAGAVSRRVLATAISGIGLEMRQCRCRPSLGRVAETPHYWILGWVVGRSRETLRCFDGYLRIPMAVAGYLNCQIARTILSVPGTAYRWSGARMTSERLALWY